MGCNTSSDNLQKMDLPPYSKLPPFCYKDIKPNFNSEVLTTYLNDIKISNVGGTIWFINLGKLYGYLCILSNKSRNNNIEYCSLPFKDLLQIYGNIISSAEFIINSYPKKSWYLKDGLLMEDE